MELLALKQVAVNSFVIEIDQKPLVMKPSQHYDRFKTALDRTTTNNMELPISRCCVALNQIWLNKVQPSTELMSYLWCQ